MNDQTRRRSLQAMLALMSLASAGKAQAEITTQAGVSATAGGGHAMQMPPELFNVFTAHYDPQFAAGQGAGAEARILYRSDDNRFMAIVGNYPRGLDVAGSEEPSHHFEAFYIVRGEGWHTGRDGQRKAIGAGEFIMVLPNERPGAYHYEPGLLDVCFFWSANSDPLPDYLTQCVPYPAAD